jgi:hypothetical protein
MQDSERVSPPSGEIVSPHAGNADAKRLPTWQERTRPALAGIVLVGLVVLFWWLPDLTTIGRLATENLRARVFAVIAETGIAAVMVSLYKMLSAERQQRSRTKSHADLSDQLLALADREDYTATSYSWATYALFALVLVLIYVGPEFEPGRWQPWLAWRVSMVLLGIYLVQLLFGNHRYARRLSAHYRYGHHAISAGLPLNDQAIRRILDPRHVEFTRSVPESSDLQKVIELLEVANKARD